MIGQMKLELNEETIAHAVQAYLNEHVMRSGVRVGKVEKEYLHSNASRWVAMIQPVELPVDAPL